MQNPILFTAWHWSRTGFRRMLTKPLSLPLALDLHDVQTDNMFARLSCDMYVCGNGLPCRRAEPGWWTCPDRSDTSCHRFQVVPDSASFHNSETRRNHKSWYQHTCWAFIVTHRICIQLWQFSNTVRKLSQCSLLLFASMNRCHKMNQETIVFKKSTWLQGKLWHLSIIAGVILTLIFNVKLLEFHCCCYNFKVSESWNVLNHLFCIMCQQRIT